MQLLEDFEDEEGLEESGEVLGEEPLHTHFDANEHMPETAPPKGSVESLNNLSGIEVPQIIFQTSRKPKAAASSSKT